MWQNDHIQKNIYFFHHGCSGNSILLKATQAKVQGLSLLTTNVKLLKLLLPLNKVKQSTLMY